jgi:hypothetical protein
MVDAETLKRVDEAAAPFIEAARRQAVDFVCNLKRRVGWASLTAEREADTLKLTWESSRGKDHNFRVIVMVYEISLYSEPGITTFQYLDRNNRDGGVKVKLQEGDSYLFKCFFYEGDEPDEPFVIMFHLGIPLSPEKKALLNKAVKMERNPEEKIGREVDKFFKNKNVFEEKYNEGVKRIKDKKLPSKKERAQIQDLKEDMEQMKEKYGM